MRCDHRSHSIPYPEKANFGRGPTTRGAALTAPTTNLLVNPAPPGLDQPLAYERPVDRRATGHRLQTATATWGARYSTRRARAGCVRAAGQAGAAAGCWRQPTAAAARTASVSSGVAPSVATPVRSATSAHAHRPTPIPRGTPRTSAQVSRWSWPARQLPPAPGTARIPGIAALRGRGGGCAPR